VLLPREVVIASTCTKSLTLNGRLEADITTAEFSERAEEHSRCVTTESQKA